MARQSAGLLVYKKVDGQLLVYLVHPGGPFWAKKDLGAWSIPKGELGDGEDGLVAARRELTEETGHSVDGTFHQLAECRQKGGKVIRAWAVEADLDEAIVSNTFEMEWPPKSGRKQAFPEVDRAAWFAIGDAKQRINPGQVPLLAELERLLAAPS